MGDTLTKSGKNDDIDNGIVEILQHEGDTDNPQYVRIRHYTHGSWGRITLSSSVNGLVPGESYVLDMYVCHRYVDSKKGSKPDHGFSLKSPSGKTLASANKLSAGAQWEYRQFAFTPDYEEATLELWSQNIIGDGFVSGLHTVSFDQVRIYQGIASAITVDAEDAPAQIYTLQGIPVAVPTAPGIYLIKRGAKVTKFRVN